MPQTQGGFQELYKQFTDFKMTVDDNPANVLMKLEELAESLTKSGITITESQVHGRFAPRFLSSMSCRRKTYARRRSSGERTSYEECVTSTLQFKLFRRNPSLCARKPHLRKINRAADRRSWLTAAKITGAKLGAAGNPAQAQRAARRATRRPPSPNPRKHPPPRGQQRLQSRRRNARSVRPKDIRTPSARSSDALIMKGTGTVLKAARTSRRW